MAEVFGFLSAIQAISQLLEQTCGIIRRLRNAHQRQQALVDVLQRYHHELQSIKKIMEIMEDEEELHTLPVATELQQLGDLQTKLTKLLTTMDPNAKSKASQFARQLVQGSTDEKNLATMMNELGQVKATLLLRMQAANVGITKTVGKDVVANSFVIERIDSNLKELCEGLKIAQLIKGRRPSSEGLVPLTPEDLRALQDEDDGSDFSGETAVDDSEQRDRDDSTKTERIICRNMAREQSMQFNAAIGEDIWKNHRVVIHDNIAESQSFQSNYAMTLDVAMKMMGQFNATRQTGIASG